MKNDKMRQVCENIAQSQKELNERQEELNEFIQEMNIFLGEFIKENNSLWTMRMEIRGNKPCFNMRKSVDRGWFRVVLEINGENTQALECGIHNMVKLRCEAEDLLIEALKQSIGLGDSWNLANQVLESWLGIGDSEEPW